jgi:hypothetical protein
MHRVRRKKIEASRVLCATDPGLGTFENGNGGPTSYPTSAPFSERQRKCEGRFSAIPFWAASFPVLIQL